MFKIKALIAMAGLFLVPTIASAQNYGQTYEQIQELNIGNPTNNRRFDRSDEVLKRKVQDRKNKVVGTLQDIIINSRGYVESLEVKFDRLNKRESVNLDFSDAAIRATSSGYMLSIYSDDEIEALYPSLLANIQTASGEDDIHSVRKIVGANVKTERGTTIGTVEDVLFDNAGNFVQALYVKLGQRNRSGVAVAIPFSITKLDFSNNHRDLIITEEQATAIKDFSETQ